LLIVVACVLAPLSVVAVWTKNQVTNTDRYLRTMAPLASEPDIQSTLADRITAKVFASVDVKGLTDQAVDVLARQGLPPTRVAQLRSLEVPVANGVESFTRTQVGRITSSAAFANAWVQANRLAHEALVKSLTGKGDGRSPSTTTR
jgi:poly(3-hydroxybutyrate) depolymerase